MHLVDILIVFKLLSLVNDSDYMWAKSLDTQLPFLYIQAAQWKIIKIIKWKTMTILMQEWNQNEDSGRYNIKLGFGC